MPAASLARRASHAPAAIEARHARRAPSAWATPAAQTRRGGRDGGDSRRGRGRWPAGCMAGLEAACGGRRLAPSGASRWLSLLGSSGEIYEVAVWSVLTSRQDAGGVMDLEGRRWQCLEG